MSAGPGLGLFALSALVILAAIVGVGCAVFGERSRRLSEDMQDIKAEIDLEREQAHRAGLHTHPGGTGRCLVCGLRP